MRALSCATAALALFTATQAPAAAITWYEYTGAGEGSGLRYDAAHPSGTGVTGYISFDLIIGIYDDFPGAFSCPFYAQNCSASPYGASANFTYAHGNNAHINIGFTDGATPGTKVFSSGSANGFDGYPPSPQYLWSGPIALASVTKLDNYTGGADGSVSFSAYALPEPASWAMMIAGFALMGAAMRRKSRGYGLSYGAH